MVMQRLKNQLIQDEGKRLTVYKDATGHLTVGIGHKVQAGDHLYEGDTINDERCQALFESDLDTAIYGVRGLVVCFDSLPDDVQEVLVNLCFNLGIFGLSRFKAFLYCVKNRDWNGAADDLVDSLWYRQVGERSKRIVEKLKALSEVAV